ncbi:helix-turn-helix transcriptional regulator [Micromonospora globispora]|uniref:helix-turn-helix transcriptional regulator n=1 Tax=Micromonospora globispora TaxID=1450148 RepID=UPI000F5EF257|nr:WYL domain-containing protein [Micromonospora globispora]RQW92282.1 transcriptional regulator [Micromonospora globispora]
MNRTDRLYALVEELRAVSPRPRSARWLAQRFEVSARTIERDIAALQASGVPIWAEPGRTGGYVVDRAHTLPPVNLTAGEAVAMAVALHRLGGTPVAARRVLRLRYADRSGADSSRDVEPLGYLGNSRHWYLLAWCRLRDELRCFRTDRIRSVHPLAEVVTRELDPADLDIPDRVISRLSLV